MVDAQQNPNPNAQPDGAPRGEGGQSDGGAQDTRTPEQVAAHNAALLSDLKVERERRKAAELSLKERETRDKLAAAKTAEDVERVRQDAAAEIAKERRTADLRVRATGAGVHDAFLSQVDDGASDVDKVVAAAQKAQADFLEDIGKRTQTIKMGGGTSPDGGGGGRVWKASQVKALMTGNDPSAFRKAEPEIMEAVRTGRYRANE